MNPSAIAFATRTENPGTVLSKFTRTNRESEALALLCDREQQDRLRLLCRGHHDGPVLVHPGLLLQSRQRLLKGLQIMQNKAQ